MSRIASSEDNLFGNGIKAKPKGLTREEAFDTNNFSGKVLLITGPTNGLGAGIIDEVSKASFSGRAGNIHVAS